MRRLDPAAMRGWVRFADIRRGGYDPAARVDEMTRDGSTPKCST